MQRADQSEADRDCLSLTRPFQCHHVQSAATAPEPAYCPSLRAPIRLEGQSSTQDCGHAHHSSQRRMPVRARHQSDGACHQSVLHGHSNHVQGVLQHKVFAGVDGERAHRVHRQLNVEHKQGRYLLGIWQGLCSGPQVRRRWQLNVPCNVVDFEVKRIDITSQQSAQFHTHFIGLLPK